jgi:hypothetical protein
MIRVTIVTPKPTKIRLIAYDSDQANTQFMNSTNIINGQEDLFIRLPLSPNNLIVKIYNEEIGNRPKEQENTFIVKNIRKEDLDVTINKTKMDTPLVNSFVKFCQKFSFLFENFDFTAICIYEISSFNIMARPQNHYIRH